MDSRRESREDNVAVARMESTGPMSIYPVVLLYFNGWFWVCILGVLRIDTLDDQLRINEKSRSISGWLEQLRYLM